MTRPHPTAAVARAGNGRPHSGSPMTMSETVLHATRALLRGTISENALGTDVMYALRGFRAGLVDKRGLVEAVARGYRSADASLRFDGNGNLIKI